MTAWIRFEHAGQTGFGSLEEDGVHLHRGDLFVGPVATGERLPLDSVKLLAPCLPSQFIGLGYNSRSVVAKQGLTPPASPFYFIKSPAALLGHDASLRVPRSYAGRVVFEGELGIVIGRRAQELDAEHAQEAIFGYTCVNDVTALDLITSEPAQWTRAKSFPGFGPFGPAIVTGIDSAALQIRTLVNGRERQSYAVSDLIFSPAEIVRLLSHDFPLEPGDVVACGTSLGVGVWKPGSVVEVEIAGIGVLRNTLTAD